MLAIGYNDAAAFLRKASDFLEKNETLNSLPLGIALRLRTLGEGGRNAYAVVVDEGEIAAAAIMTPPHNVCLSVRHSNEDVPDEAITLLAKYLTYQGWHIPGVMGVRHAARQFATTWQTLEGSAPTRTASLLRAMRMYDLSTVVPVSNVAGHLRLARTDETPTLINWMCAFQEQALAETPAPDDVRANIDSRLRNGDIFVWDTAPLSQLPGQSQSPDQLVNQSADQNGNQRAPVSIPVSMPVSMAMRSRPTRHTVTISAVYTPVEARGRGYASACVAALSQSCLTLGFDQCVLFTDLANPTANSIYQKIGYRPVADFDEYRFQL